MAEPLRALSIAFFEGRLTPASKLGRFQYGPFPRRSARAAAADHRSRYCTTWPTVTHRPDPAAHGQEWCRHRSPGSHFR